MNDMSSSSSKHNTSTSNSNIRNLVNTNDEGMGADSDSDSSSEEEFEREMSKFTHDTGDVTADKWNNPKLLIAKYNQLGLEKLEEDMIASGVEAEKAKSTAMLAQIMALQIEIVCAHRLEGLISTD